MYLLRHGQSEFNVHFAQTRVDPGIEDPALTDLGRQQAEMAARHVAEAGLPVREVVASPYTRTLQTAEAVAALLGLPITIDPLVRERCWFACDIGTPTSRLRDAWPAIDFGALSEVWWPRGGETPAQLDARCAAFALRMSRAASWHDTLYVTHWGFIRGLTGLTVGNGTLVALARGGQASVVHSPET